MYLTRATAAQWAFWQARYYRIDIENEQHLRLRRLETNLNGSAAVRYAAPAFHTRQQLEHNQVRITVLRNSHFASPGAIGPQHSIYSYRQGGSAGYSNREPHKIEGESYESLIAVTANTATEETLVQHLERIAAGVIRLPGLLELLGRFLSATTELSPEVGAGVAGAVADLGLSCLEIGRAGASWWILDFGPMPVQVSG